MSNYTYAAGLAAKDALPSGNAGKVISGAGLETEFVNIQTAIATKIDSTSAQPLDAQLTTLAAITAQQATDLASLSAFVGTVLNDADGSAVLTTLGVSAFAKTILDDTSGEAIFATMGAAKDVVGDGYQKLPGGVIIQWGTVAAVALNATTSRADTITFPLTFPTAVFVVVANAVSNGGSAVRGYAGNDKTTSGFTSHVTNDAGSPQDVGVSWIAVGN